MHGLSKSFWDLVGDHGGFRSLVLLGENRIQGASPLALGHSIPVRRRVDPLRPVRVDTENKRLAGGLLPEAIRVSGLDRDVSLYAPRCHTRGSGI